MRVLGMSDSVNRVNGRISPDAMMPSSLIESDSGRVKEEAPPPLPKKKKKQLQQ